MNTEYGMAIIRQKQQEQLESLYYYLKERVKPNPETK